MLTVKQASSALGISNTTLRQRGAEYAEYLSDFANPPKGDTRKYTEDDIAVLLTVGVLKSQNASEDAITAALAGGERLEPVDMPQEETRQAGKDDKALVTSEFAAALQSYETQLNTLQKKNDDLHERLLDAEKRAAIAQTKLEALSIMGDAETSPGGENGGASETPGETPATKLTRRQRLARWIGGE